jgi:D-tyrosyl-tRNA(Tyr) deacylase
MRAVIQKVSQAKVEVEGNTVGQIQKGLLVYISVGLDDTESDAKFFADKIPALRIFPDRQDKMNLSVIDVCGSILLVSNFTLHGDCRKGRRPSFDQAAKPELAKQLYEMVAELIRQQGVNVQTGVFAANMQVESINDGPVNFILNSR